MKKLPLVLGAALLLLGVVAAQNWRDLRLERRQNDALQARVAALESQQRERSVEPGSLALVAPSAVEVSSEQAQVAPAREQRSADDSVGSLMAQIRKSMETPQGREFATSMVRTMLEQQYPDLAKALGLSNEEAGRLLDEIARHQADAGPALANLQFTARDDPSALEEMNRLIGQKEQDHEARMAALLGDRYQKWKEYERTSAQRQQQAYVRQGEERLRTAIGASGRPLGDAQFQGLNAALRDEQQRIDRESAGLSMQQQLQQAPQSNRRLIEVAAGHLDPGQLEHYRVYLGQQEAMMQAMAGAMGGEAAATPAGGSGSQ